MGVQIDEGRLRQLFNDMTADQPAAPPGRYRGIQRMVRRRRLALAAGSIAAIAVIATSGIGISAISQLAASGSRQVPAWALPWPDHRNGSVPQRVLDQAVVAWVHLESGPTSFFFTPSSQLIWYVGQTVADGQAVAVIFEADSPAGPRLVAGWAAASEVMHGQPGWASDGSSPWSLYSVPAPSPHLPTLAIGLNVRGTRAGPSRSLGNTIVELTGPAVHTLVVLTTHPAREALATYTTGGLLIHDVGLVTGRVQVSAQLSQVSSRVRFTNAVPVGLPGSPASEVPLLALPAPLTHVGSFILGFSGQGGSADSFSGEAVARIIARCYGPAPLRIAVAGRSGGAKPAGQPLGTIPCDNGQHQLWLRGRLQPVTGLQVSTSDLTSWRVALAGH